MTGAEQQAAALAERAAAHAALDDPDGVASLLGRLREAGAEQQAAALLARLPAAGMFGLFLEQEGRPDQFRFGREPDGTPAAPWDWDDLDLRLAPAAVEKQEKATAAPARASVRGPPTGHAGASPCRPGGLQERCLVRPVRSIVR